MEEFHNTIQSGAHGRFQRWRSAHPIGINGSAIEANGFLIGMNRLAMDANRRTGDIFRELEDILR